MLPPACVLLVYKSKKVKSEKYILLSLLKNVILQEFLYALCILCVSKIYACNLAQSFYSSPI
jgi:hypothetical protein